MSLAITCPTGCDSVLPLASVDLCSPEIHFGEIQRIYFTNPGNPLVNVESAPEWIDRLSNTSVADDAIRFLYVSGDLAEPEKTETIISLDRKKYSPGEYTLNFDLQETNDINYDLMRTLHCNLDHLFWFATESHIYGGASGITGQMIMNEIIEKGAQSLQVLRGMIKFKLTIPPARSENVLV